MTETAVSIGRPPFVIHEYFLDYVDICLWAESFLHVAMKPGKEEQHLVPPGRQSKYLHVHANNFPGKDAAESKCPHNSETAFEQRFQGLLREAWMNRSWHVIAAIPGSGKSLGIADLVQHYASYKESKKITKIPLLAIRAPKNGGKEQALAMAFSTAFGVVPSMPWSIRRFWLVEAAARAEVECLIIDDAQDLNLTHLAFLKELTDNLAAPPHNRQVGLCLVTAISGNTIPFKEVFTRPDTLWRQFPRRLHTTRPFCTVLGHTLEETCDVLMAFEDLSRSQLPEGQLCRWVKPIFSWLTHPTLDPDGTKRVTMDHLTRFVLRALHTAHEQGANDVDAALLEAPADLMILRRDEMTRIDGLPSRSPLPIQEVG